jgi:hypothetical protein
MNYTYLHDFILSQENLATHKPKEWGKLRHNFYALDEEVLNEALTAFDPFPDELKNFYQEIGFGYFYCNKEGANRILDPYSLIAMNKLEGRFAYDIELKRAMVDGHLVFFHTHLNQFLTIDRETVAGKNAIYYKKQRIAGSLRELFTHYAWDRDHLQCYIKDTDKTEIKKGILQATLRNIFVHIPENNHIQKTSPPAPEEEKINIADSAAIVPETTKPPDPSQYKTKWVILPDDDVVIC